MSLPPEALDRLSRLGYTAEEAEAFWNRFCAPGDDSMAWWSLDSEETAAAEYRVWFPRLQAFVAECRRAVPVPDPDTFSTREREEYRVLLLKMREFAASEDRRRVFNKRRNRTAILTTTRAGLAAAEQVFARTRAVILGEKEDDRWSEEVYRGAGDRFWYTLVWWTVEKGLSGDRADSARRCYPIPDGCSYWAVTSGDSWAGAGGARSELWRWDGTTAEFIGEFEDITY